MSESDDKTNLVAGYRVGAPIGMGAAANVFDAIHVETGERVALKILNSEWADRAEIVSRFVREGRALQRLRHPNIVRVIDHGVASGGEPWIALERLRAINLDDLIQEQRRLDPARAIRLAIDVARALGAVHEAGIIHRDVKPSNVLVVDPHTPGESAKLIDFGIAKVSAAELGEDSVASHTRVGSVLGSAAYASPEQLAGTEIDMTTDVFALAVTLYEALSGALPFDGDTVAAQIEARTSGAIVPLHKHGVDLPRSLGALFVSSLSVDRTHRPANGYAMASLLAAVLAELELAKGDVAGRKRRRSRRLRVIVAGSLVAVLLVTALFVGAISMARSWHLLD